jgi:uncharacterized membrane protein YgcG
MFTRFTCSPDSIAARTPQSTSACVAHHDEQSASFCGASPRADSVWLNQRSFAALLSKDDESHARSGSAGGDGGGGGLAGGGGSGGNGGGDVLLPST